MSFGARNRGVSSSDGARSVLTPAGLHDRILATADAFVGHSTEGPGRR